MKITLYGTGADRTAFESALAGLRDYFYREIQIDGCSDYDSFVTHMKESPPELVAVTMDGAAGMEGVIASKSLFAHIPVIWFSDDRGFGVQSYRLDCAYFHEKPVSPQILCAAIAKCVKN